jgi:hypothetical protein
MPISPLLDAGPGAIVWDADGTPTVFQTIFEDMIWKDEQQMIDIFEAQHGSLPVDKVTDGILTTFEANITRVTLEDISVLCIGGTLSGAANDQIEFTNPVGDHMYQYARRCVIKPIINAAVSTTAQQWITVYKAICIRAWELPYGKGQRAFHCVFHAFPDQTSGNQGKVYKLGTAT